MRILITGICGFIGHHVTEHFLKNTGYEILGLDKLNYASCGFDRLRDINCYDNHRVRVFAFDFTSPIPIGIAKEIGPIDYIFHLGAETHVDRSIDDPELFLQANVIGTRKLLDYARTLRGGLRRFFYFSTDEVLGPAPEGINFKEDACYNAANPYAASKAAAEQVCLADANTYQIPLSIVRSMNAFGERQHPEKFIPLVIKKVLKGEPVFIHSDKTKTKAGSRFYIHCRNIADALLFLISRAQNREIYHIVGEREIDNLSLARFIAKVIGKPLEYQLVDFHSSRPGHDLRYALDGSKMAELGWRPPKTFEESLEKTIRWTLANQRWLEV